MSKTDEVKRFIIYGAGAIGGIIGGHLALAGEDVIMIGRPGPVKVINERGLKLIALKWTKIAHPTAAVTSPAEIKFKPADVVFLCVKSQNTEGAMKDLKAQVSDIPVFCFQNGVANEEIASRYFPRVYSAMLRLGGRPSADGEVTIPQDPTGAMAVGKYPSGVDDVVKSAAEHLRRANIPVVLTDDIMPYKWGKLLRSLVSVIPAITNDRGPESRRIGAAVKNEARQVYTAAGIRWLDDEQVNKELDVTNESFRPNTGAWKILTDKRGTLETDFMNGEIVRLAKKAGVKAPMNEALTSIAFEMLAKREVPGKYPPAELMKILGMS